ncbi:hypothetical protein GCK32_009295 [Trichostrongylus colubriformis]|uniref:Uncharacterized protein n=1 Tax=Trichostrongylus colubriformis TaxID=6319 RepID=A0AAN8GBP2_TRICO
MNVTVVCLLVFQLGAAVAQFYSMSGYACGQPALYTQCQCPTFCSPYTGMTGGYGDYSGYNGQEFPEPPSTTPKTTTHTWEDEDLWEKKFVGEKTKGTGSSEELPEISSAEVSKIMTVCVKTVQLG